VTTSALPFPSHRLRKAGTAAACSRRRAGHWPPVAEGRAAARTSASLVGRGQGSAAARPGSLLVRLKPTGPARRQPPGIVTLTGALRLQKRPPSCAGGARGPPVPLKIRAAAARARPPLWYPLRYGPAVGGPPRCTHATCGGCRHRGVGQDTLIRYVGAAGGRGRGGTRRRFYGTAAGQARSVMAVGAGQLLPGRGRRPAPIGSHGVLRNFRAVRRPERLATGRRSKWPAESGSARSCPSAGKSATPRRRARRACAASALGRRAWHGCRRGQRRARGEGGAEGAQARCGGRRSRSAFAVPGPGGPAEEIGFGSRTGKPGGLGWTGSGSHGPRWQGRRRGALRRGGAGPAAGGRQAKAPPASVRLAHLRGRRYNTRAWR
jgi:hypothetical protein